ncbi:hypothetical protein AB0A71_35600 [Kitasatospora aureofaciens]|uniref:hypothetical protein n=1 Tax=Kitasatospora aureofaciens TaxID=1894 RepID=UPI0033F7FCAE
MNAEVHYPPGASYTSQEEYYAYLETAWVSLTIGADYFSCPACQLVLNSYDLIRQAGLGVEFEVEGDIEDIAQEPEYGND